MAFVQHIRGRVRLLLPAAAAVMRGGGWRGAQLLLLQGEGGCRRLLVMLAGVLRVLHVLQVLAVVTVVAAVVSDGLRGGEGGEGGRGGHRCRARLSGRVRGTGGRGREAKGEARALLRVG